METENNSVGCDDIPSFMNTTEYHEKRMSRLFEQHKQEETQRRTYYQLKREQKALQVRRIKNNRKIVAISVIVCGIMITAFATTLIANNAPVNDTKSTIEIEAEDVFGFIDYMHIEELRRAEASRTTIEESPKTEVNIDINDKTYDFAFESRLAAINSENHFQVGFSVNSYLVDKITQNRAHGSFLKYGEMYGIDPYLIMALAMQESSFQHSSCTRWSKLQRSGSRYYST